MGEQEHSMQLQGRMDGSVVIHNVAGSGIFDGKLL